MSRVDRYPETPGMSIQVAAYRAARDYRGGIQSLALEMGVNYSTLSKKLNPGVATHNLYLEELISVMTITMDERLLQAFGQRFGLIHAFPKPMVSAHDHLVAISEIQLASSAFTQALAPFVVQGRQASDVERATLQDAGYRYISALLGTVVGAKAALTAQSSRVAPAGPPTSGTANPPSSCSPSSTQEGAIHDERTQAGMAQAD